MARAAHRVDRPGRVVGRRCAALVGVAVGLSACGHAGSKPPEPAASAPRFISFPANAEYLPILAGPPQSRGMEAGRVTLPPGAVGELHSTQHYEEVLVVLLGTGELRLSGRAPLPIAAPGAVYVPPHTEHVVANTSTGSLVYVYVAAPTR